MTWGEIVVNVCFYLFALGAVAGALTVARSQNIVRTAFALAGLLLAIAALYALAGADFIAAIQGLIYVGGIVVLVIFAVMLTHRISDVRVSNASTPTPAAFFIILCLLYSIGMVIVTRPWGEGGWQGKNPTTEGIAKLLMGEYLLPFEVVSLLLLIAMIGAAYLARKEVRK
ncbi:MAG: hypothetical protein A2Z34_10605 [Planctomycetes bacterium RBG_16_59_8]|nr:MAG: hypothetical protein A2Z34_10605 [Planctomycetes bacterium RBG_16_59_8]